MHNPFLPLGSTNSGAQSLLFQKCKASLLLSQTLESAAHSSGSSPSSGAAPSQAHIHTLRSPGVLRHTPPQRFIEALGLASLAGRAGAGQLALRARNRLCLGWGTGCV